MDKKMFGRAVADYLSGMVRGEAFTITRAADNLARKDRIEFEPLWKAMCDSFKVPESDYPSDKGKGLGRKAKDSGKDRTDGEILQSFVLSFVYDLRQSYQDETRLDKWDLTLDEVPVLIYHESPEGKRRNGVFVVQ